jgi:hypothetical protein
VEDDSLRAPNAKPVPSDSLVSLGDVIRLRRQIERGLRHPFVGPLLLLALAVLVAFIALHQTSETIAGHAELICVAIALVLLAVVPGREAPRFLIRVSPVKSPRGPPIASRERRTLGVHTPDFLPLRL